MVRIDVKNGKLVNTETEQSLGDKLIVTITGVKLVALFEGAECTVISLKDRGTGVDYFIIPGSHTAFSLRYAAYSLGSRGRTAADTPLILKVNSAGQLEFNFDFRLRSRRQKELVA